MGPNPDVFYTRYKKISNRAQGCFKNEVHSIDEHFSNNPLKKGNQRTYRQAGRAF